MSSIAVRAWEEAVRHMGMEPPARVRPNPLLWLKYAGWGRLSDRHRGWVLYDATCSTWVLRHFARLVTLVALPVTAIAAFLPTSCAIRALTAVAVGLCAILFPGIYINEATDHRLAQADFPPEIGPRIRDARAVHGQRLANAARRDRVSQRRVHRS